MASRFKYLSIRSGLIGHWRPSRGATGNTLLDSVRGNHGTLTNGPTWQASGSGLALSFDGTDDFVTVPNVLSQLSLSASVSTWFFNRGNFTGYGLLFGGGTTTLNRDLCLFLGGSASQVFVAMRNTAGNLISLSSTMQLNAWTHLVLTSDGTTARIYVNGVSAGSATNVFGTSNLSTEWRLSSFSTIGGAAFNGLQDSVSVHSAVLTPGEILTLYTAGRGALDQRVKVPVVRGVTSSGGTTVTPTTASLALAGFAPSVLTPQTVTPNTASLATNGFAPAVSTPQIVTPSTASLTLSTFAPAVTATANQTATPTTAPLSLSTSAPSVTVSNANTITTQTATLALTTFAPTVTTSANIVSTPNTGTFSLSAFAPSVSVASASVTVTPIAANLTITAFAPTLSGSSPTWTVTFSGNESCSGGLSARETTGDITAKQTTGDLVASQLEPV